MNIALDDQALWDAITGSGAFIYGWWFGVELNEDQRIATITADDGDDSEVIKTLTVADMRQAIAGLAAKYPDAGISHIDWTDPECDSDVDANDADCILQFAVLGDIVFG